MPLLITITRADGPTHLCGKPHTCNSFDEANQLLRSWSNTVSSGYDKCDFTVFDDTYGYNDPIDYRGRYDLRSWKDEVPNLKDHILQHLSFYSGHRKPDRMTQGAYE